MDDYDRITLAICSAGLAADLTGFVEYVDHHTGFAMFCLGTATFITNTFLVLLKGKK